MNKKVIPYSKVKVLFRWSALLIGLFIFEWFLFVGRSVEANASNHIYYYSAQLLLASLFIWVSYYGLRTAFSKYPGLVFEESGFHDNSSGAPAGFVSWRDVTAIKQGYVPAGKAQIRAVFVEVKKPEKYISKGTKTQRISKRMSHRLLGSAIVVSSSLLAISHVELVKLFEQYLTKYVQDS